MSHITHHDDCGCLTARYEARIAELEQREREFDKLHAVQVARVEILIGEKATLEAEVAEAQQAATFGTPLVVDAYKADRDAALAHAATLRDALEQCDCETLTNGMGEYEGHDPKCVRCTALASTPAASLAAYRAEVLEQAAIKLERLNTTASRDCAAIVRALAAQEVKRNA